MTEAGFVVKQRPIWQPAAWRLLREEKKLPSERAHVPAGSGTGAGQAGAGAQELARGLLVQAQQLLRDVTQTRCLQAHADGRFAPSEGSYRGRESGVIRYAHSFLMHLCLIPQSMVPGWMLSILVTAVTVPQCGEKPHEFARLSSPQVWQARSM